jgi:DNA (cytosine-5)-methyltransferase 1
MTKFSRLSRFGMTYAPLTASRGEELLTLYLAGFPAKTSAPQDKVQVSLEADQDSGLKWQGLLGKYDHATRSWKTAQCSLLEDLEQCLEIWPRWGLMRDGVSYQQQTLVRHISESESGLWATPTCMESLPAMKSKSYKESQTGRRKISSNLRDQIFQRFPAVTLMENQLSPSIQKKHPLFPTPLKSESNGSQAFKLTDAVEASLGKKMPKSQKNPHKWEEFKTWPTPRLNDYKGGGQQMIRKDGKSRMDQLCFNVEYQETGRLNPTWVEWLMGWPLGWTDLKPLETDKCQEWQQQHLNF